MRRRRHRSVAIALAFASFSPALAEEDLAPRVRKAHEAARANAESPEGREWKRDNSFATDRLLILVLNRCLPEAPGEIPTAFAVYVRLSQSGAAREIITELDPSLEKCMTTVARDLPFPEAPRDDYWIQVNMAAPL
jgi:hypothetical protein